ncbi:neuroligin-3-like isoform X2 [Lucilia sericata]|uniref:neuroligin-3-like isoform X2 n=1 Tax=Lucilia sericata TaxID=13632 RepID=UPI0018A82F53|nr:neuroligin-3-like isoform X2 [Lucilia sericata]
MQILKQYKSPSNEKDSLIKDFKENLQNLLKSSNISDIKLQPQFNEEYVSTATTATIKRAAIMLQPQSTTSAATTPTTSTTMPPLEFISPTSGASAAGPASTTATTTNKDYNIFYAHSTPVERRHIIPEKLQYTREIYIKQGRLMGIKRNFQPSSGLRAVDQYLGLPYAEAPVGSRRFMPPGAALPWQGLKMAHHLPPVCPQKLPDISLQGTAKMSKGRYKHLTRLLPYLKTESEDCLYLNVYVPNGNDATATDAGGGGGPAFAYASAAAASRDDSFMQKHLYPVVVYIHGESFEWNSGNAYDGSVLASYGEVIVVTVNYRLGIFGFMRPSINENTVANFGLLDQIAALHWIKENIHSFGGDKDSVTLMGHTTGAACINYLMVSPVASGLFHRAILMSGSAMSDWAATNHSLQLTMQIAHGLNCPLNDDNEEMLSCLRQKRYQDILKIRTTLSQFSTSLGPIVDGHVIPNQPYKVMGQYTEHFSRYDLLFGITESESYHSLGALALEEGLRENERDNLLRFYMQSRFDVRPDLALAATLKKYSEMYNNPIKATNMEHRDVVLDILSDARVVGPLMQTGLFHADVNRHNYMYVFGHNSFGGPHASGEGEKLTTCI